jgi:hypothetical protein
MEGTLSAERVRAVATQIFPSLRHVTRGRTEPVWRSDSSGLNQLVAIALIERGLEAG